MMQSKKASAAEAVVSVVSGFLVGIGTQMIIFPWFGIHTVSFTQNVMITLIFSATSLVRSYFIRRFFNKISVKNR
jgi:membrane protein CcdC involved in cytochrome C biogenesis